MGVTVEVRRGGVLESRHRVHVAVVDRVGKLIAGAGDPERSTFARSSLKPVQTLPLVEDGVVERFGLSEEELALACSSHGGEPVHAATALSMLEKIGLDEEALACGSHPPFHQPSAEALRKRGEEPRPVHNNCSGKHAGMLALARFHDWPLEGYHRADHPVQRRVLKEVALWSGVDAGAIATGVDGCGVITFALPLRAIASTFASLGAAAHQGVEPAATVIGAMIRHPGMVGGTDRACTALSRCTGGAVVAKLGAEGVFAVALPDSGRGMALKVEDGARRAAEPALIAVLEALGVLEERVVRELERHARPVLRNTLGEPVGDLRARVELSSELLEE